MGVLHDDLRVTGLGVGWFAGSNGVSSHSQDQGKHAGGGQEV